MKRIPLSVALLLLAGASFAATPGVRVGSFPPGERVTPPELHAPAQVSRAFVQSVTLAGGRASVDLPVRGGGPLLIWTLPLSPRAASPSSTLHTPAGRSLAAGESGAPGAPIRRFRFEKADLGLELPDTQETVSVDRAEPGLYQLELLGNDGDAVTIVVAEPASALTLAGWVGPLSRQPGQPLTLRATLRDGAAALRKARVVARLAAPGAAAGPALELFDDGRHGDAAAGDGVYGATLSTLPASTPGLWTARFEAYGHDASGVGFARTGSGGFVNEPGAAALLAASARLVGPASARRLRIEARADVAIPGDYRLDAIVAGAAAADGSRPGKAWGERTQHLEAGPATLLLEIPQRELGPVPRAGLHVDVRLLGLDALGVAGRLDFDVTR